eukprot:GGOE01057927.1.p5 GENE.GGOE01057927.1~~GGOE01057927.1.p5  ORF type:complete len:126 (-),score=17.13 GGOE01057927.1:267-644(-)
MISERLEIVNLGSFSPASHGGLCPSPCSPTTPFQQMVNMNLVAPLRSLPNLATSRSLEDHLRITPHLQMAKPLPVALLLAEAAIKQKAHPVPPSVALSLPNLWPPHGPQCSNIPMSGSIGPTHFM